MLKRRLTKLESFLNLTQEEAEYPEWHKEIIRFFEGDAVDFNEYRRRTQLNRIRNVKLEDFL